MKYVLTFFALLALIWGAGTYWCVLVGLRPGGFAQVNLLAFLAMPLAATSTWAIFFSKKLKP